MWNQKQPRQDYGPIGSKIVKNWNSGEDSTPKGLIYAWLSDSILPGGRLVNDREIGVPTMKKATPSMLMDAHFGSGKFMDQGFRWEKKDVDEWMEMLDQEEPFPASPSSIGTSEDIIAVYKQSGVPVNISIGSSGYESDLDTTPDPGSPGGESTQSTQSSGSSTVTDLKDFKERFGYMGDVLPFFQKKQKKGKYFKSFSSR